MGFWEDLMAGISGQQRGTPPGAISENMPQVVPQGGFDLQNLLGLAAAGRQPGIGGVNPMEVETTAPAGPGFWQGLQQFVSAPENYPMLGMIGALLSADKDPMRGLQVGERIAQPFLKQQALAGLPEAARPYVAAGVSPPESTLPQRMITPEQAKAWGIPEGTPAAMAGGMIQLKSQEKMAAAELASLEKREKMRKTKEDAFSKYGPMWLQATTLLREKPNITDTELWQVAEEAAKKQWKQVGMWGKTVGRVLGQGNKDDLRAAIFKNLQGERNKTQSSFDSIERMRNFLGGMVFGEETLPPAPTVPITGVLPTVAPSVTRPDIPAPVPTAPPVKEEPPPKGAPEEKADSALTSKAIIQFRRLKAKEGDFAAREQFEIMKKKLEAAGVDTIKLHKTVYGKDIRSWLSAPPPEWAAQEKMKKFLFEMGEPRRRQEKRTEEFKGKLEKRRKEAKTEWEAMTPEERKEASRKWHEEQEREREKLRRGF